MMMMPIDDLVLPMEAASLLRSVHLFVWMYSYTSTLYPRTVIIIITIIII